MEYRSLPLNPPLIVPPWRYNQPQQKSYRIPIGQFLSPIGYGSRAERRAARLGCRAAGRSLLPPRGGAPGARASARGAFREGLSPGHPSEWPAQTGAVRSGRVGAWVDDSRCSVSLLVHVFESSWVKKRVSVFFCVLNKRRMKGKLYFISVKLYGLPKRPIRARIGIVLFDFFLLKGSASEAMLTKACILLPKEELIYITYEYGYFFVSKPTLT